MRMTKLEIAQFKDLMQGDKWELLMKLLGQRINDLNAKEITGLDSFQTLKELHTRDGMVKGLKEFFDSIERGISE